MKEESVHPPTEKLGFAGEWIYFWRPLEAAIKNPEGAEEKKGRLACEIWKVQIDFSRSVEKDGKIMYAATLDEMNGDRHASGFVDAENPKSGTFIFPGPHDNWIAEVELVGENENKIYSQQLGDDWYRIGTADTDRVLEQKIFLLVAYWLEAIDSGDPKYAAYIEKTAEQMYRWPGVVHRLVEQPAQTSEARRRVAHLLAEISDRNHYEGQEGGGEQVKAELINYAIPWFQLHTSGDPEINQEFDTLLANLPSGFDGRWITFMPPDKAVRSALPWLTWEIWKINVHFNAYGKNDGRIICAVTLDELNSHRHASGSFDATRPNEAMFQFMESEQSRTLKVEATLTDENIIAFKTKGKLDGLIKEKRPPGLTNWYRVGSLEAEDVIQGNLRTLVNAWTTAIASDHPKKTQYIEETARQMRFWPGVVRYLVYQLNQTFPLTKGQRPKKQASEDEIARSERITLAVHRRVAQLLAEMSDRKNYKGQESVREKVIKELTEHAIPWIVSHLANEGNLDIRRDYATLLANLRTDETIAVLVRAVVSDEKLRGSRQEMLAKYYLEPSLEQSGQAATILEGAVNESKRTLGLLQTLNVIVLLMGMTILVAGFYMSLTNQDARMEGLLAGLGGFAGVITLLIKNPLNSIQNSLSNLVQLQSAFTSFIWELNLSSTYIQSQYVADGVLHEDEITSTLNNIENAMEFALTQVATYTEEGREVFVPYLTHLRQAGNTVTVYGNRLKMSGKAKEMPGQIVIALNHTPRSAIKVDPPEKNMIEFKLTDELLKELDSTDGLARISLVINGVETNALPLHLRRDMREQL